MTPLWRYTAIDIQGTQQRGAIAAMTEAEAALRLDRAGLTPLSLASSRPASRPRATLDHRAAALRRLAALAAAHAPLDRALKLSGGSESAKGLFMDLALAVSTGRPLSEAFMDWPADFSEAESALIASGELAGDLPRALDAAATLVERRAAGRRAVGNALAYPAFILLAALLALAVFIGFAQPRFEEVLRATGADISTTTKWFFAISGFLRLWGGPLLLLLASAGIVAIFLSATAFGKRHLAAFAASLPLIGPLLNDRAHETYAGALAAMVTGGTPLADAARLAARTYAASHLAKGAHEAAKGIAEGQRFSAALGKAGVFPESLTAFVEIGEETGALAPLMDRAARHFGQEAEARARRLSAIAAPAITAFLGLLIGIGAWLMMTAVLDVYDAAL